MIVGTTRIVTVIYSFALSHLSQNPRLNWSTIPVRSTERSGEPEGALVWDRGEALLRIAEEEATVVVRAST